MSLRSVGSRGMNHGSGVGGANVPSPKVRDQKALSSGVANGGSRPFTPRRVCHSSVRPLKVTGVGGVVPSPVGGRRQPQRPRDFYRSVERVRRGGRPRCRVCLPPVLAGAGGSSSRAALRGYNGTEAPGASSKASQLKPARAPWRGGDGPCGHARRVLDRLLSQVLGREDDDHVGRLVW